jgi:type I restriction enzyme S subunit
VAVLRIELVSPDFASYQLQSPFCQVQIDDKKTETAQANIFQGKIRQIIFALPPLNEQRRIVAEIERRFSIAQNAEQEVASKERRAGALRSAALKAMHCWGEYGHETP